MARNACHPDLIPEGESHGQHEERREEEEGAFHNGSPSTADAAGAGQVKSFCGTMLKVDVLLILTISLISYVGIGSVVGVLPDTLSDRYARLRHGHDGPDCGSLSIKPQACQDGTDDAQAASAWSSVGMSMLGLFANPVVGSLTDTHGRRWGVLTSLFVTWVSTMVFLHTTLSPHMDPMWFYMSQSLVGGFHYLGLVFAALSDIVPESFRAASFGLLLACVYGGFAVAPSIPLYLDHQRTTIVYAILATLALVLALLVFPETLLRDNSQDASQALMHQEEEQEAESVQNTSVCTSTRYCSFHSLLRPLRELSILNRDCTLRFVAGGTVISAMVFASDISLVLYYAEEHFDFGDADIANMLLYVGIVGLVLQGVALQPLSRCMGDSNLLLLTFASGTIHNFLYGVAKTKQTFFAAIILSQLTKVNFPVLASFASKQVSETEQGRIQGAISACVAIGSAAGPLSMEFVYQHTKNLPAFGPGFMFLYASGLYAVGTVFISLIPRQAPDISNATDLGEPLLPSLPVTAHREVNESDEER